MCCRVAFVRVCGFGRCLVFGVLVCGLCFWDLDFVVGCTCLVCGCWFVCVFAAVGSRVGILCCWLVGWLLVVWLVG